MGYSIQAVFGSSATLRQAVDGSGGLPAVVVELRQGVALVPMTDELLDAIPAAGESPLGFWRLPAGFERMLADWSVLGPIGYAEADFFGGDGEQRAVVWAAGRLELGPLHVGIGQSWPAEGSPISQMLARLGVDRGDHYDEFDAAGLLAHRRTADWIR